MYFIQILVDICAQQLIFVKKYSRLYSYCKSNKNLKSIKSENPIVKNDKPVIPIEHRSNYYTIIWTLFLLRSTERRRNVIKNEILVRADSELLINNKSYDDFFKIPF